MKVKDCKTCKFLKSGCANSYRAAWKDKFKCETCWHYSKSNETSGYCLANIHNKQVKVIRMWCYSGCAEYKKGI